MLYRAIALSLALLIGIGTMIPLMTDYSEAGPKYSQRKKKRKKLKKYSKAWWRWYHASQKRKRATIARRRAIRARQILLARQRNVANGNSYRQMTAKSSAPAKVVSGETSSMLPSGQAAPQSWKRNSQSKSEVQYSVNDQVGNQMGGAKITVVGTALGEDDNLRSKTIGGVTTNALRRTVIDKMMREEGWIVNDYQKALNGKKVYVVVAQSSLRGVVQSRLFYFTEADGRIYSVAASAPESAQEQLAAETEKAVSSLYRNNNRAVQAELR